ncbi:MAG TPA: hypothetical protein VN437_01770, partial [Rectinemataceae bacterium]|nr:hypothetical protein [Rectinemataceae bacterium]
FSSRVVIWPERNVGIAILSAQGGVIQSNVVLPLLTSAAEKILFSGSSPRLFPFSRVLFLTGITSLVYLISMFLQTATSLSWTKAMIDQQETSRNNIYRRFILFRTVIGIVVRAALLFAAPLAAGWLVGRPLEYHDLLTMEPGLAAFFILAAIAGILRNLARLMWFFHLKRG